jgi:hypothetical protein
MSAAPDLAHAPAIPPEAEGYSSAPVHWAGADPAPVPRACAIRRTLCDVRIPLGLSPEACDRVADILVSAIGVSGTRNGKMHDRTDETL